MSKVFYIFVALVTVSMIFIPLGGSLFPPGVIFPSSRTSFSILYNMTLLVMNSDRFYNSEKYIALFFQDHFTSYWILHDTFFLSVFEDAAVVFCAFLPMRSWPQSISLSFYTWLFFYLLWILFSFHWFWEINDW